MNFLVCRLLDLAKIVILNVAECEIIEFMADGILMRINYYFLSLLHIEEVCLNCINCINILTFYFHYLFQKYSRRPLLHSLVS